MARLTAIDLFCGCGGLTLGLKNAGFSVVAGIDSNDLASATYRLNHRRTSLIQGDIRTIDPLRLRNSLRLKKGELSLLAGCPPCQGFSSLRTLNGKRRINDPTTDLLFEFERFARCLMPRAIMLENVSGLARDKRLIELGSRLAALGYDCQIGVFDAAEYGTPQFRKRLILTGTRDVTIRHPRARRKRRTVREVIGSLPRPERSRDPIHSYFPKHTSRVLRMIASIPPNGGSRNDLPARYRLGCHERCDGFKDVYGRMSWDKPAPTITGGCINPSKGRFLHPEQNRAITLREAALLQGFPKSYKFDVSQGRYPLAQIIGNAFPPPFAEHHAKAVWKALQNGKPCRSP